MGLLYGTRRTLLGGARREYYQKVLGTGPIAYWPLWEDAGGVAECLVNPAQNGTYAGVTLGQPGIGDGRTCPLFDGLNDSVNINTAALQAAFDGSEGSVALWARVFNVGVWTDGSRRGMFDYSIDANNVVFLRRDLVNNRIQMFYRAGGVTDDHTIVGLTSTDWMHIAMTWSAAADQVRYYYNGGLVNTRGALGVWAGVVITTAAIGMFSDVRWYGWLAHCAIWDTPLTPDQIADLAVV